MSLAEDAERLRAMAAEAIHAADRLERDVTSKPPYRSPQPVAQQQQQMQPKKEDE
jgi:hypothetical protein